MRGNVRADFLRGQFFHQDTGGNRSLRGSSVTGNDADGTDNPVRFSGKPLHDGCLFRFVLRLMQNRSTDDNHRIAGQNIFIREKARRYDGLFQEPYA